jgi:hypothetical protein
MRVWNTTATDMEGLHDINDWRDYDMATPDVMLQLGYQYRDPPVHWGRGSCTGYHTIERLDLDTETGCHSMVSNMVVETDTAPEEEDDRKAPAPEDDTDSKGPAPDNGDADCFMIHLPTALETQIRATVVNRRHLNTRFRIEDNHYIKLDGGSDISVFKHVQAFSVLKHARQLIALGLTVGDNRTLALRKCIWAPTQEKSILSQTHYQYFNKAYIMKVDHPVFNSIDAA